MSSYLVLFGSGSSQEFDADFYEQGGSDWIFTATGSEVVRIPIWTVVSITKA